MSSLENISEKLIDIHTHRKIVDKGIFTIKNLFPEELDRMEKDRFYSIGLHPWYIRKETLDEQLKKIGDNINNPQILAIGECGLDRACQTPLDLQQTAFAQHIEIAKFAKKPLIIHCVKAYPEIIKTKKESKSDVPWIIHGFQGNSQMAEQLVKNDFYLSLGEKLRISQKLREAVTGIPFENVFLESDESSCSIIEIYEIYATLTGITVHDLQKMIATNFLKVFNIDEQP